MTSEWSCKAAGPQERGIARSLGAPMRDFWRLLVVEHTLSNPLDRGDSRQIVRQDPAQHDGAPTRAFPAATRYYMSYPDLSVS